ncbi:MAG: hypothetical protein NTV30_11070 [Chloroflexi bacterium]|nr:hypothetical protein [Chloroflexota bacterium]
MKNELYLTYLFDVIAIILGIFLLLTYRRSFVGIALLTWVLIFILCMLTAIYASGRYKKYNDRRWQIAEALGLIGSFECLIAAFILT